MNNPFALLYHYRKILCAIIGDGLKTKYAGSTLGLLWLIFYPILFLGVYAVIYIMVFKVRLQVLNPYEYVLLIFCGLVPFLSFAEALGLGTFSVVSNSNILKNTLFPIDLMPVKDVIVSQAVQVVGFVILITVSLILGRTGLSLFALPVVWVFQVLFSIGLIWLLSALNVFIRDLGYLVSIINLILMLVSPIAYTEDMVPAGLVPFLKFNPLYYMILLYQKIFLFNTVDVQKLLFFGVIGIVMFFLGYYIFTRLKVLFSDQV